MLTIASGWIVALLSLQANAPIILGVVERDLTGDGKPEILRLTGVSASDNLAVTFTIESGQRTIYRYELAALTRTGGLDARRQTLSAEEQRARIKEFGRWFFDERKFQRPAAFVDYLRGSAPARVAEIPNVIAGDRQPSDTVAGTVIWQEIRTAPITIFTFSPGGDKVEAIGWSRRAGRFYRLLECC